VLVIVALVTAARGIRTFQDVSGHHRVQFLAAGVIEKARRRQRRRRVRLLVVLLIGLASAAAVLNPLRATQHASKVSGSRAPGSPLVAPGRVLSKNPYMGVDCPQPNAISCDRVGLAIWLKRPAFSVDATIAGQPLKLDWFGEEPRFASKTPRTEFDGYLQPAELTTRLHVRQTEGASVDPVCGCRIGPIWISSGREHSHPQPLVRLEIRYPNHTRVVTELHVYLGDGWG